MTSTRTDPIPLDWSTIDETVFLATADADPLATASDVSHRLALLEIGDIRPEWVPLLAASAAELASAAGLSWRFSTDDPVVALLRLIAKVTMVCPGASGPHTVRLLAQLP
jgi:hypothetical protein